MSDSQDTFHQHILCTVDVVLLTLKAQQLQVGLIQRDRAPFEGAWSLPGGFVHTDKDRDALDAAQRVLLAKTGLVSPYLEQLQTFSGPSRDPRGWSVSVAYFAVAPFEQLQGEGVSLKFFGLDDLRGVAFDHLHVIQTAAARLKTKSAYSSLPAHLCGETFTLSELQAVYETLLEEKLNKGSFLRRMVELDIVEAIEGEFRRGVQRPAQLYRLKPAARKTLSLTERPL